MPIQHTRSQAYIPSVLDRQRCAITCMCFWPVGLCFSQNNSSRPWFKRGPLQGIVQFLRARPALVEETGHIWNEGQGRPGKNPLS